MADEKKGLGLFISKRAGAAKPPDAASATGEVAAPKNVKKRWMYVLVAVGGLAVLASMLFASKQPAPPAARTKGETSINLTPTKADERALAAQFQQDIQALKEGMRTLKDENRKLLDEAQAAKAAKPTALPEGIVAPPTALPSTNAQTLPPAIPPPPPAPPRDPKAVSSSGGVLDLPPVAGESGKPLVFRPDPARAAKPDVAKAASTGTAGAQGAGDEVRATVRYVKNPYSGFLPAGAFAPVALLNGLDAGTGTVSQSNPQPVLMNIQDHATLPGSARYSIRNCFVLGSAYGDLSAERVYIRLAQLTCIDKRERMVLSQAVQGYVVDSDGKLGMRGVLVDRQGAKLAKAMLAGFAQGLASAFGSTTGTQVAAPLGGTSTIYSSSAALTTAALSGASTAASQLASFYLKEAQAMFPVITVDAGRVASLVFTQGAALVWGSGESVYQREVKPQ